VKSGNTGADTRSDGGNATSGGATSSGATSADAPRGTAGAARGAQRSGN
jgi:hypothetical protein